MLLLRYFVQGRLGSISLKYLRLLKPIHFIFLLGASYFVFVGYGALHSTGQIGSTKKNGDGCTCHGDHVPTDTVHVWIEGPDTVLLGDAAVYTVFIKGGPALGGGFNVATSVGTLSVFDGTAQIVSSELTHTAPKSFANDSVAWRFFYQAPASGHTVHDPGEERSGRRDMVREFLSRMRRRHAKSFLFIFVRTQS